MGFYLNKPKRKCIHVNLVKELSCWSKYSHGPMGKKEKVRKEK